MAKFARYGSDLLHLAMHILFCIEGPIVFTNRSDKLQTSVAPRETLLLL